MRGTDMRWEPKLAFATLAAYYGSVPPAGSI